MQTTNKSKKLFRKILATPLILFFSLFMSNHTKRLFYFGSLYGNLLPIDQLKRDMVIKLNAAMQLARADDALMVPAAFSRVIWGNGQVAELLESVDDAVTVTSDAEVRQCASVLVKMASRWLRFGTVDEMLEETERFIRCIPEVKIA